MTYIMTVTTESKNAADTASCDNLSARSARSCAARALGRLMVAAGMPDGPIEARGPDGRLRYAVRSLHAFAKFTIAEQPRIRCTRWTDMGAIWKQSEADDASEDQESA